MDLWTNAKEKVYPEIDKYENSIGFSIDYKWFHKLALHTQIVIKKSELCYQHGRIIYSALSAYVNANNFKKKDKNREYKVKVTNE